MGIGLVLAALFVFYMAVACALAVVLGVLAWSLVRQADPFHAGEPSPSRPCCHRCQW